MSQQPGGTPQSPDNPTGSAPESGFPQPGAYPQQPYPAQSPYPQQPYPGQSPYPQQPYPGQQYPQPGYEQGQPGQQYPQPGYEQAYPGQQYPQAASGQQQSDNPYQITHFAAQYAAQGYQPEYSQPTYQERPVAEARSPMLGMIGFGLVAVSLIAMIVAIIPVTEFIIANADLSAGSAGLDNAYLTELLLEQLPMQALALNIFGFAGFAGWVVSIVATATRRGRGWGVFGIILGVLAPFIILGVMMAVMFPAMAAMR